MSPELAKKVALVREYASLLTREDELVDEVGAAEFDLAQSERSLDKVQERLLELRRELT